MASCIDPSSPRTSGLSLLEKQKIYLNQQQKQQQQLHQSANYIVNFTPFPAFKPINEESSSSIATGQVYNPTKSLVNGWPDFSMASAVVVAGNNSDAAREMNKNQITENMKKRKCENDASLKAENSMIMEDGSSSNKKAKQVSSNNSQERNANTKEGSRKGKNKKEQTSESSEENPTASTVTAKPAYIHVRARRGQATDSHSLAERVHETSLQELVPGCNKVTGKAALLQFNPLQRPAAASCYGLEMPIENPNPGFTGSIPEQVSASHVTLGDQYLNVNLGSSNWDIGPQNLYCPDPQQARALGFPF